MTGTTVPTYDVAVIGLGVMGCAALANLAGRGCRTVGIDRYQPGHDRGSSHGSTRIIRLGYFEHPSYVPLLRAAYPLWRELEARTRAPLLSITGILEIGAPDSELVAGTLRSSRQHGLAHEILDAAEVTRRFPAFRLPGDFIGVLQPDGGFVQAERTIEALLHLAQSAGAALRFGERVLTVAPHGAGVRVTTEHGAIDAGCAVVAAGPWMKALLPEMPAPLRVTRQVLGWFEPHDPAMFEAEQFPVFLLQNRDGTFYGFPRDGDAGVKIAKHHHADETAAPDQVRAVSSDDETIIRTVLRQHLPDADGRLIAAKTCLYTLTPDGDFIIDRWPTHPQIIIASPCSGHGFKFAPLIGEILADLALTGTTPHDIARFGLARFG